MEDRKVTVSRVHGSVTFPASFMLVAAMNPCPCGYYGDPFKECKCSSGEISRYHKRLSGPLLDRIDIFVDVPHIDYEKLTEDKSGESARKVRARVKAAHEIQLERFRGTKLMCNADMTPHLTGRAFHRILKLSRTIADLEQSDIIKTYHMAEALQYRHKEII